MSTTIWFETATISQRVHCLGAETAAHCPLDSTQLEYRKLSKGDISSILHVLRILYKLPVADRQTQVGITYMALPTCIWPRINTNSFCTWILVGSWQRIQLAVSITDPATGWGGFLADLEGPNNMRTP